MARRLKQPELLRLLAHARQHLWAQQDHYPLPRLELDREQYLEQVALRALLIGRWHGAATASQIILQQRRWGPVSQARAHDAILEAAHGIWLARDANMAERRAEHLGEAYREAMTEREANARRTGRESFWNTIKQRERDIAAFTTDYTGQLDALRAASRAIAGYPERVQALLDLEHPERARAQERAHDRDRGRGS